MLVFEERGKLESPEKNLSEQSREPTNSAHVSVNRTRDTLLEGERSHHYANPAPNIILCKYTHIIIYMNRETMNKLFHDHLS